MDNPNRWARPLAWLGAWALAWCVGCADGTGPVGATPDTDGDPAQADDAGGQTDGSDAEAADCVAERLHDAQGEADLCRACHTPTGLASTTRFLLERDRASDAERLRAAYAALGDELLAKPSQEGGRAHGGGRVLTQGSAPYAAWAALVSALGAPTACVSGDAGAVSGSSLPLLGSSRGGHVWATFCEGKVDATELPPDPRSLVVPGANDARAVHFNAFWAECDGEAPRTCGEYRAAYARGKDVMEDGKMWFFGGNDTDAMLSIASSTYNDMWRDWGFRERPANYDALVAERWGIPLGTARNPYPLPGEDPVATDGGSGQLPVALTQLRDQDGKWLGKMSFNCHWCHSGKVGDEGEGAGLGALYGSGNSLLDVSAGFGKFTYGITGFIPLAANKTRGTGDILLYPAIAALDFDRAQHYNESIITSPSQGSVDYPVWWNSGHRTRRFHDGSFAMDDSRPVMGFFMPIFRWSSLLDIQTGRSWIEERDQDVQLWLEAITAPAFPKAVDEELASAGAVLFHQKDLWAPGLDNPAPRPEGGNGSCAGCHGAYAPRFVNDDAFLARPEFEGIASYVVPLDVIDTDPARANSLTDRLSETLSHSWWGYGTNEEKGACFDAITPRGYLAPPLYGVWASAPYFHNASVPNLWQVLDPSARPEIWRRVSAPAPAATPNAFTGFDGNLGRAYDFEQLGFRYDVLGCDASDPALDCTDVVVEDDAVATALQSGLASDLWFSWNIAPQPVDQASLEKRKIYNTHKYSQGNGGHAFTAVLTDAERRALLEYLKTL